MKKSIIIALLASFSIFGQEVNFKKYLSENNAVVDLKAENQWKLLKSDAEKNQFIILGESHGAQDAQLIDFNLLQYLNAVVGTKNYIAELDYAQSSVINEFLKTGDEAQLKSVFRHWVKNHKQWGNKDFYDKILKIRKLNLGLPKAKRIVFTGIDNVQDVEGYLKFMQLMIGKDKSAIFGPLQEILNREYNKENKDEITLFAKKYLDEIQNNRGEFQQRLKKNFPIFEYLIQNLSYSYSKSGVNRAEQMFRNYKQLYGILKFENQKLYGMWGYFHAHLVPVYFVGEDFASKLVNSNHPSAHKIISIGCLPIDSNFNVWDNKTQMWTKNPFSYDNKTLLQIDGIEDLKELSLEHSTSLFKLNSNSSPFPKTGRLFNGISPQGKLVGNFTSSDYGFHYIVLMRNSDWLQPLPLNF